MWCSCMKHIHDTGQAVCQIMQEMRCAIFLYSNNSTLRLNLSSYKLGNIYSNYCLIINTLQSRKFCCQHRTFPPALHRSSNCINQPTNLHGVRESKLVLDKKPPLLSDCAPIVTACGESISRSRDHESCSVLKVD
ncbi:hypothetical protein O3G_MSEX012939 [Manduca sexta]|uniref:Uncharacterized protein n=1 Tax=Manduca sexta TaxID=7130 RepID=A0A921ZPS4_MANSE|nr:hypothetical protein O3G_MSEX012939 [Manduca sexta]